MINFLEYVNIFAEADAPTLGAPSSAVGAIPPLAGGAGAGAGAMPPAGDTTALSAPSSISSPVPAASGGGGGAPPMDAMGAAPAGDVSALKAPNINLEDAYDHLEHFFSTNKK